MNADDKPLHGRVALVTGASKGIGRGIAEHLAASGASLVVSSRDDAALTTTAHEIAARHGVTVVPVAADVADLATAALLIDKAIASFGSLDILVNNSGGPPSGRFLDLGDAAWRNAFDLLLLGVVRLIREAYPHLRDSGRGRIVTVASTSVKQPIEGLILSNALRSAVVGLSKTLAAEFGVDGITVNVVAPGNILTDRLRERAVVSGVPLAEALHAAEKNIPLGRIGDPNDLGALVAFLCTDAAAYITGTLIPVDGGLTRGV